MRLVSFLVVVFGVATVYGGNRPMQYGSLIEVIGSRPRMFEPRHEYPEDRRDDRDYRQDRIRDHAYRRDRSQVVLTAHGLVPPVFTPRHHDGSLNLDVVPELAEFFLHNGIKAVEILGTDGEGPALSVEDRKRLIDEWVRVGKKLGMHIMVQVGAVSYPRVIATAKYAQAAGADSIMILPEVYYKPTTIEELIDFIDDVGRAAPHLPVLYYHYPNMTGVVYPPPEIVKYASAHVSNFRGIKYDTNDLSQLTATLERLKPGQELFLAADRLIAPAALLGVRSALSGTVNFWPRLVREIFDAVEHSDVKRARELQEKLTLGYEAILAAGNTVSALKAAMEIVTGIKVGPPGHPLPMITEAARHKMEHRLRELGLVRH